MKTFNLLTRETGKERAEVFYEEANFNSRLITLSKNEEIPPCDMDEHVIFVIIKGKVKVSADNQTEILGRGETMHSTPATMSMKALEDSRVLGIQINQAGTGN